MGNRLRNEADLAYQKMNHQWLKFHYHIALLCILMSVVLEVFIYFIVQTVDVSKTIEQAYWLKYLFFLIMIEGVLFLFSMGIVRVKTLCTKAKIYSISIVFMLVMVIFAFVFGGYYAILFCFMLPILMTIMYENQKLTSFISICTMLLETMIPFLTIWSASKDMTNGYIMNMFILVFITLMTWIICYFIIRFSLMKKEIIILRDVERQELKERILLDDLTMVKNKQALLHKLNTLVKQYEKFHLVMLDLDDFKHINDQYGHVFGDEVLKCLGMALLAMGDNCDVYRYGGDEFCILMWNQQKHQIIKNLEQLQCYFQDCLKNLNGREHWDITMSIGIARYHLPLSCMEIMKQADAALYESKKLGKSEITYYE